MLTDRLNRKIWSRAAVFMGTILLCAGLAVPATAAGAALRSAQNTVPWTVHTVGHVVTFSYPSNFVDASDAGPNVQLTGGALLNTAQTAYKLLLGVEINSQPGITATQEVRRLKLAFAQDQLLLDRKTAYGRELSFLMPGSMTYTLYVSPIAAGVREIIINNEQSNPAYQSTIAQFLSSVHNQTVASTEN